MKMTTLFSTFILRIKQELIHILLFLTEQCGTYSVEGDCYNREHVIPQSTFNSAAPMVSDAHFIPPTDGKVNGIRSSFHMVT
jgi:endonuclease I